MGKKNDAAGITYKLVEFMGKGDSKQDEFMGKDELKKVGKRASTVNFLK